MNKIELNADFDQRVHEHGAKIEWLPSPMKGVDRRMLERIGDEVARATSIVRYAPKSKFSSHVHTGGEEFLVIDGVFQDEHGDFPTGTYVRNPPASSHTPGSDEGCTIFVKLWQFEESDRNQVVVDTTSVEPQTIDARDYVRVIPLFNDKREDVRMELWQAGKTISYAPEGGMEILVVKGGFAEGGENFAEQSWLRLPVGSKLDVVAGPEGATLWVKEGHLSNLHDEAYAKSLAK